MKKKTSALLACALAVTMTAAPGVKADDHRHHQPDIDRVLLISIDGMHAVDYANCVAGGYCPNLANLGKTGVNYVQAYTSKPSDSFPGLMAIVTGGSPKTVGAYYDVAYDRSLQPPKVTTGNGVAGGACVPGQTPDGTRTEYEEGIDFDQTMLDGGASTHGGVAINPDRLPRDPANNCAPVQPYNFVRTNTVFGVIHAAHGYTAWSDKHPAYNAVSGPGDGTNLDDFFGPEINSVPVKAPGGIPITGCTPLPDQSATTSGDDFTTSFQNIQCYDGLKVQAIINEIDGKTHDGKHTARVPEIFGMNFQAVSVGEKLIYNANYPAPPAPFTVVGGYQDAIGTPSGSLLQEIKFVDGSIGSMVHELNKTHQLDSTLIIITAKHGQAPIDPARFFPIPGHSGTNGMSPATILDNAGLIPFSEAPSNPTGIGPTEDDVSLLWLNSPSDTPTAIADLESDGNAAAAGIGEILAGNALSMVYNVPGLPPHDPRTPDIIVTPNFGVVYTGSSKKLAEHGGFSRDDTNVMTLLSNPDFSPATITTSVTTAQIAPTILEALGLDPSKLQAVQQEGTPVLPGLF